MTKAPTTAVPLATPEYGFSPAQARPVGSRWTNRLLMLAKAAVSALICLYIASRVDLRAIATSLDAVSPGLLILAGGAFLLIPVLGGLRWWGVLKGIGADCPVATLSSLFSVAMIVGQFLPMVAGDGARILLIARRGYGVNVAINSVFLERVAMVLVLLILVLATGGLLSQRVGATGSAWAAAAMLLGGAGGLALLCVADRMTAGLQRWRPVRLLAHLSADTRRLILSKWALPVIGLCLLGNLNFVLAATLLGRALSLPTSFEDFLAFIPLVTVATILPISLGGWGVREGVLIVLLGHVGVASSNALTLSLMFGLGGMAAGLPGFIAWCLGPHRIAGSWIRQGVDAAEL